MPGAPVTILGGLPVWAEVFFGVHDYGPDGKDYWAEVDNLFWLKHDGTKGKQVPQSLFDKAMKNYGEAAITEQVSDYLAGPPDDAMFHFDPI